MSRPKLTIHVWACEFCAAEHREQHEPDDPTRGLMPEGWGEVHISSRVHDRIVNARCVCATCLEAVKAAVVSLQTVSR